MLSVFSYMLQYLFYDSDFDFTFELNCNLVKYALFLSEINLPIIIIFKHSSGWSGS